MGEFPEPKAGTVFYDDGRVYACFAFEPKVHGHTIVAWKEEVKDLSLLSPEDPLADSRRSQVLKTLQGHRKDR